MENLEKLKQRLINLEIEQKRQDREVKKLSDLDEEIRQFEEILANFNDSALSEKSIPPPNFGERTDLDEIDRLEKEIEHIDETIDETQEAELEPQQITEEQEEKTDDYSGMDENERHYFEEIRQLKLGKVKHTEKKQSVQRKTQPTTTSNKPNEVEEVEAELAKLDNYVVTNEEELRYLEEIKKLKADLGLADVDKTLTSKTKKVIPPPQKKTAQENKQQHGYVICLMFDPNSPNEWSEASGGGWRERGGGTCYQDLEQMKQCLRKIKKQWPNYPLRVVKR
jgi:hypothetical protein